MKTVIIKSHPYEGSYNAAIIDTILKSITSCTVIDLLKDQFNPVMTVESLKSWSEEKFPDEQCEQYFNTIFEADLLIFPFPVWWGGVPAVLKGFFDKVLIPGKAYHYDENGEMVGNFKNTKAVAISTMEVASDVMENFLSNPPRNQLEKVTLNMCGIEISKYFQIDKIVTSTPESRKKYLADIEEYFKGLN